MVKRFRKKLFNSRVLIALTLLVVIALAVCGAWAPANAGGDSSMVANGSRSDGVHHLGGILTDPADVEGVEQLSVPGTGRTLVASVDLSSDIPPIGDQRNQNSCVAWATSYYYKSWSEKQKNPALNLTKDIYQFSPAFVYNQINGGEDNGSTFYDAFNLMQDVGDIQLAFFPYDYTDYTTQPTAYQLDSAEQYRIPGDWGYFWLRGSSGPYSSPNDISGLKAWLASGNMLNIMIPLYVDFPEYDTYPASPYYNYNGTSAFEGWHGVAIVGYDDNANPGGADADHRGGFLCANSWGSGWNGDSDGYVYLSYDLVKRYVPEAWGMNDVDDTSSWYLAEGSTDWGFECYVTIENPNNKDITCDVTYMTESGEVPGPTVNMPMKSQATVNPFNTLGTDDFSTKVECRSKDPIAVDRTMLWASQPSGWSEAHCSVGVTSPAKTWYLPEGSSAWGFECWLLIQNPGNAGATCQVTYMIEGEKPRTFAKVVPARSRSTFNMADDIGEKDASIKVASNQPVIPERAMYRDSRREGHESIGTTRPMENFYLAEGATGYSSGFETYVLVQNPNDTPADVTVTYMTAAGPVVQPAFEMPANSRQTILVNSYLPPNTDFSTAVKGTQPIIAERAMYWYGEPNTGQICHDSIGMSAPHVNFYLPAGGTSNQWETWTLVQNPNSSAVEVEVSYLPDGGGGTYTFNDTIPANSRKTYNMADEVPDSSAAVMVKSLDPTRKIMVERAMYWNGRNAGTSTIGGYSDSPWTTIP
ncbi:MAG: C1 family peptidase [Actinobacteria bacterium]|nr:C1 family peptidase [Actinomycetota bacterium]